MKAQLIRGAKGKRATERLQKSMKGKSVEVGIVETARYPIETLQGRPNRKSQPFVATVAFWNEFGTKGGGWGGRIPERPFMRRSIRKYLTDGTIKAELRKMDPLNPVFTDRIAGRVGLRMQAVMQEGMLDPTFPPNAPATIAIKTKTGTGPRTTPLIDEGRLRQAINFQVKG